MDIFGTPAGMGRVLDKKSSPVDLRAFKKLIKETIRELSCNKKYNIWYEVWNAPDLDDFFLGRQQEYFNLYRIVAEAVVELEQETNRNIPIGGPSVSWWFQALESNTILAPERSLVYGLIRYCYSYRLPLDFVSWHGYSSDPLAEQESTVYHKYTVALIRDWLQPITYLIPLRYFLVIAKGLFLKDIPAEVVWNNIWPMAIIGAVTLMSAGRFFKRRLE